MNLRLAWIKVDTSRIASGMQPMLSLGIVNRILKINTLLLDLLLLLQLLVDLLSKLNVKFGSVRDSFLHIKFCVDRVALIAS